MLPLYLCLTNGQTRGCSQQEVLVSHWVLTMQRLKLLKHLGPASKKASSVEVFIIFNPCMSLCKLEDGQLTREPTASNLVGVSTVLLCCAALGNHTMSDLDGTTFSGSYHFLHYWWIYCVFDCSKGNRIDWFIYIISSLTHQLCVN